MFKSKRRQLSEPEEINNYENNHSYGEPKQKILKAFIVETVRIILFVLIIVLPIRLFVIQPFRVSGESMETTFQNGEYLIVDQISYRFTEPEYGEVIVFRYPKNPSKYFIKRLLGMPSDTITIKDSVVSINGVDLDEPYARTIEPLYNFELKLGPDEYFVLGDNRNHSSDSRTWGALPKDKIVGRALIRLFPLTNINLLPGYFYHSNLDEELKN